MEECKGFTLKCNKCGKEYKLEKYELYNKLFIYADYDGEITIECECNNKINI